MQRRGCSDAEVRVASPRALVAITAMEIREGVLRAAGRAVDVVRTSADADEAVQTLESDSAEFDVAIVDVSTLRALQRHMRRGRSGSRPAPPVILVLQLTELQDALALLHLCHGIVFWENEIDKLASMIVVALDGYSTAPAALLPDLVTDRVRVGLIERLTAVELRALELLGSALSNRAIAERLEISEPVAKSLVRTVLTKLRLKNRTEAAVLVARWRSPGELARARDLRVNAETTS
jgi:DNA-binding NarL/FixJ family response regulator